MKKYLLGFLVFIVGAALLVFIDKPRPTETPNSTEQAEYVNTAYGYSLSYPGDMTAKEYNAEEVSFSKDGTGLVEARIVTVQGKPGQSFEQSLFSGTENSQPLESSSGVKGLVRGPFYVFPLKTNATLTQALIISPTATINSTALTEQIAKSLKLSASKLTIEEYVSQNISSISPEKEVLGGKFYVTAIEAHGGSGSVSYEDGHIALTADFTYTVDQTGNPSITSFKIRK